MRSPGFRILLHHLLDEWGDGLALATPRRRALEDADAIGHGGFDVCGSVFEVFHFRFGQSSIDNVCSCVRGSVRSEECCRRSTLLQASHYFYASVAERAELVVSGQMTSPLGRAVVERHRHRHSLTLVSPSS